MAERETRITGKGDSEISPSHPIPDQRVAPAVRCEAWSHKAVVRRSVMSVFITLMSVFITVARAAFGAAGHRNAIHHCHAFVQDVRHLRPGQPSAFGDQVLQDAEERVQVAG